MQYNILLKVTDRNEEMVYHCPRPRGDLCLSVEGGRCDPSYRPPPFVHSSLLGAHLLMLPVDKEAGTT